MPEFRDEAQVRLYGTPGAEHLYRDLDSAADAADPYPYVDDEPIVLEEWTIRPVDGRSVNVELLIEQAVGGPDELRPDHVELVDSAVQGL